MTKSVVGIMLIVFGIVVLGYHGLTYTTREKAVDAGPIQISVDRERSVPPIFGGLALAIGAVLLISSKRS
jgi:hypothetical protein